MKSDQQLRQEITANRKLLRERKRKKIGLSASKGRGCRVSDRDEAAKKRLGYVRPDSFVRRDGSEVLKGIDWTIRKQELRARSDGQCEYHDIWSRCCKAATITAHVNPRHPKRDDRMSNLKHYCYEHDRLTEKQSWRRTRFGEAR